MVTDTITILLHKSQHVLPVPQQSRPEIEKHSLTSTKYLLKFLVTDQRIDRFS